MNKAKTKPSGLRVGDIIQCSSLTQKSELMPGTFMSSTVRAAKGKVLVALLLGEQQLSGGVKVDPVAVMKLMGWVPGPGMKLEGE